MRKDSLEDTIAAIATPYGQGGIGIIRISGGQALDIADKIFESKSNEKPSRFKNYSVHYGNVASWKDGLKDVIDEALLVVMRGPRSYTCEDVVELQCHGGITALRKILILTLDLGARLAEPGEFTKRAFLNGRIDLTQAEAVLDIIQAKTETFLKASVGQLQGDLVLELKVIREQLMDAYTEMEAIVNFPEDDIDVPGSKKQAEAITQALARVEKLLETSEQGHILKEGITVVICGKPNVGKSSLLNVFLKKSRAIVSAVEGTTRDSLEETVQIEGIPLKFVDTAGILQPRDEIEQQAVERSRSHIAAADIVLFLIDASKGFTQEDFDLLESIQDQNVIVVLNKCDCPIRVKEQDFQALLPQALHVKISALCKQGIEQLEREIVNNALHGKDFQTPKILISNMRQIESLKKCSQALLRAQQCFSDEVPLEFISEEMKQAVYELDRITGKNVDSDLIDRIFSSFCIGK